MQRNLPLLVFNPPSVDQDRQERQELLREGLESLLKRKAHSNKFCNKSNELVRRVFGFTEVIATTLGEEYEDLKDPYLLAELALGLNRKSIKKAMDQAPVSQPRYYPPLPKCSTHVAISQSPEEKGKRLLAKLPPQFIDTLRQLVHHEYFFERKIVVAELKNKLLAEYPEMDMELSKTTLWRIFRACGFKFRKITDRLYMYESAYLTKLRHKYLAKIHQYRDEDACIIYMDETWLFEGLRPKSGWINQDAIDHPMKYLEQGMKLGPTPCPSKGKRAIVIGAIGEAGIVPNTFEVMFDGGDVSDGDYHRKMTAEIFHKWFIHSGPEMLRLAGNRKCVLVFDNASYHCMVAEALPTKSASKTAIIEYLLENHIICDQSWSKVQLVAKLEAFYASKGGRASLKKFSVDEMAEKYGIEILRLPPYHACLNPIEKYWAFLKGKIGKETTGQEKLDVIRAKALDIIAEVTPQMNANFFNNALHEEQDFINKEGLVFVTYDPSVDDNASSSDYEPIDSDY